MLLTGCPALAEVQWAKKCIKRQKVAGVQINTLLEMKQYVLPLAMPTTLSRLLTMAGDDGNGCTDLLDHVSASASEKMVYIPQDDIFGVEGACFTGPMQVQWLGQLAKMPCQWVMHGDSKFKLHHGEWVLTTFGTHILRWDTHHLKLVTTFVPLIYLICKQHESIGACTMGVRAAKVVAKKYYDLELLPGATMADHCDGLRTTFRKEFPTTMFGTCWPHIIRKWKEGEYCKKTWEHFDDVAPQLLAIHLAHTPAMRDLLILKYGEVWDTWPGGNMNTFWNTYCRDATWRVWSVGLFDCMLCTPSQQTEESWHKQLLQSKIPGMFKGSTEHLFNATLPALVDMDAVQLPTTLTFDVPSTLPAAMIKKALWYVDHQETHIQVCKNDDEDGGAFMYYVLRKDNETGHKKISQRLIDMYDAASEGKQDARIKDLDYLADVCGAFQLVQDMDPKWKVPRCEYNPCELDCIYCKGFKSVGICSHVLAINHMLKKINLRRLVIAIGQSKQKNKTGRRRNPEPALQRMAQHEPDSSDEEIERALLLGGQGK